MQVLKDEARQKIMDVALREFREKGFENASMRRIAKKAGMTVGNLYRYFKHKDELFSTVVNPAYLEVIKLIKESMVYTETFDHGYVDNITRRLLDICGKYKDGILILFEGSSGTKFGGVREEVVSLIENFLKDLLTPKLLKNNITIEDPILFHLISQGFIDGVIMLAKHQDDEERLSRAVSQFIAFYFNGIVKRFV